MSSGYSAWWKRKILYKIPKLFKLCPNGNYHWGWDRMCYCMYNEYHGKEGGVYDFKYKHWIQGDIVKTQKEN